MRTGTQTRTGALIPGLSSVRSTTTPSKAAKQRLKWIGYCHGHGKNARLTCHHFGIAHRTFFTALHLSTVSGQPSTRRFGLAKYGLAYLAQLEIAYP